MMPLLQVAARGRAAEIQAAAASRADRLAALTASAMQFDAPPPNQPPPGVAVRGGGTTDPQGGAAPAPLLSALLQRAAMGPSAIEIAASSVNIRRQVTRVVESACSYADPPRPPAR